MAKKINDALLVKLELTHRIISSSFDDTYYAIPKVGGGIIILSEDGELPILDENVEKFVKELLEVWDLYKIKKE